jgi:dipeptidyl aminopeptidase/acylaminoacyl peptidase
MFARPKRGLRALAIAWRARIRRTAGSPCLRIYPDHYRATYSNYRAFALTPTGAAVGSPEIAACYRLAATVPYRVIRPYLSSLGKRLVAGVRAPARVATAPDGTIAIGGGAAPKSISLISPASGRARKVVLGDRALDADLSPDGRRLALGGFRGISVALRDGSRARRILKLDNAQAGVAALAWSPNGRRLAFIRGETLYTIAVKGGAVARLADHADAPDWSADGREIIFVRDPERSSRDGTISAVRSTGGGVRRVVGTGRWFGPSVSPDGSKVAFYRNGVPGIYVAPAEGGLARLVIRNGLQPQWSPDGRYLAFVRDVGCDEALCSQRTFAAPASRGKARAYGPVVADMLLFSWTR